MCVKPSPSTREASKPRAEARLAKRSLGSAQPPSSVRPSEIVRTAEPHRMIVHHSGAADHASDIFGQSSNNSRGVFGRGVVMMKLSVTSPGRSSDAFVESRQEHSGNVGAAN